MARTDKTKNNVLLYLFFLCCAIVLVLELTTTVVADVASPTSLTSGASGGFNESQYPSKNVTALAGNVTEVTIVGTTPTKAWQGYYGNITGTLTLEDASGNVFYNWTVNEPKGEVYASKNSSITWTQIECFNFTANETVINLTEAEAAYNIDVNDSDGINETFNETSHSTFYVGTTTITTNTCPSTYVFDDSGTQSTNWENILLTDNESLIFTTIIENDLANQDADPTGFNGIAYDFQLLVAEDGHDSDFSTTEYFFWVELE